MAPIKNNKSIQPKPRVSTRHAKGRRASLDPRAYLPGNGALPPKKCSHIRTALAPLPNYRVPEEGPEGSVREMKEHLYEVKVKDKEFHVFEFTLSVRGIGHGLMLNNGETHTPIPARGSMPFLDDSRLELLSRQWEFYFNASGEDLGSDDMGTPVVHFGSRLGKDRDASNRAARTMT
ncbi:hypothetical protein F5H01DRAFT_319759 [Linnemannia elongata]|nr:hypothetical protein F5H01DRAFT_319759 [Linnemannia elongata]